MAGIQMNGRVGEDVMAITFSHCEAHPNLITVKIFDFMAVTSKRIPITNL